MPQSLSLSKEQFRALVKAIEDTFDQPELDSLLRLECGKKLANLVALPMQWGPLVTNVVQKAEMQAFTEELVLAVAAWRPRSMALARVLRELSSTPGEGDTLAVSGALRNGKSAGSTLEGLVRGAAAYADVDQFLADLAAIAARVCRIEDTGAAGDQPEALDTGFLVGADLVLTNKHVRDELPGDPARIACRFDYRALAGSVATRAGIAERPVGNRRPKQSRHSCETKFVTPPLTTTTGGPAPSNDAGFQGLRSKVVTSQSML